MVKQLSYQYSKPEFYFNLADRIIGTIGFLVLFIFCIVFDALYDVVWGDALFIILFIILLITSLVGFYMDRVLLKKRATVQYDSENIYVIDKNQVVKMYKMRDLVAVNRLGFSYTHCALEIINDNNTIDTIYLCIDPISQIFLTKEAKELIKYAEAAKNEKVRTGWVNPFIFK
jgi:hypothetical protein